MKGKQEDLPGWSMTLLDLQISNNREFKELTCWLLFLPFFLPRLSQKSGTLPKHIVTLPY